LWPTIRSLMPSVRAVCFAADGIRASDCQHAVENGETDGQLQPVEP
jgi:hypothetical protein